MIHIPKSLIPVLKALIENEGVPYLVGGAVRDHLLGLKPKDYDFEIFELETGKLMDILRQFGKTELVDAKSFGIINLHIGDLIAQFSVPRTEIKVGEGRDNFKFIFDPFMTLEQAQARRDFTVNSIYIAIGPWLEGRTVIKDFYNGQKDLKDRILRHTSHLFVDDPLRVLRGMRFGGKGFRMHSDTILLCQNLINLSPEISRDRVRDEFLSWAKTPYPSMGLSILEQTGWITLFPTLVAMVGCEQEPEWHPEGDVWTHTSIAVDKSATIARRMEFTEVETQKLVMSALLHDCGKPVTTIREDGRIKSPKHDVEGAELSFRFLKEFKFSNEYINSISELVALHMWHVHNNPSERSVRRLLSKLEYNELKSLIALIEADHSARPPLPEVLPEDCLKVLELAEKVKSEIQQIILGRHIQVQTGIASGKWFGPILKSVYERQLNGDFNDIPGGMEVLREELDKLTIPYLRFSKNETM